MRRNLYFLTICCYFGCTLAHSLDGALRSYRFVYGGDTGSGIFHAVRSVARQVSAFPIFEVLASYAGTDTGYGFFAPQVGSSFRLEVSALDTAGRAVAHTGPPLFAHPHSQQRFHSLLNRLQHVQSGPGAEADPWAVRHARALSHCVTQRIAKWRWGPGYTRFRCTVSAYRHATLRGPQARIQSQYVIIYQHIVPPRYPS